MKTLDYDRYAFITMCLTEYHYSYIELAGVGKQKASKELLHCLTQDFDVFESRLERRRTIPNAKYYVVRQSEK